LPANVRAALLLLARMHLRALGLADVSAKAVLEATGAAKSRAYELVAALQARLDDLVAPVGRPASVEQPVAAREADALLVLTRASFDYLLAHPGAAQRVGSKACYDDGYRDFVVAQCEAHPELDVACIADAFALPVTTLRDWLRAARASVARDHEPAREDDSSIHAPIPQTSSTSGLHVQTVLAQWSSWCGGFSAFCEQLQRHHGIPFGRTTIASILEQAGVRRPSKRRGRSPDEVAMRGAFESYFPGAVWVGDGREVVVELEGQRFTFNLELVIDADTDAAVGIDVRDHEDADAVIESFAEAKQTTSNASIALLLDNKPSNHAPVVHEATTGTLVIPATTRRPQNKAHVEGAFGLFSQHAPPLHIDGATVKERARALVELAARLFFGAFNMRPRAKRGGRSRIELYREAEPTTEQIEAATAALRARLDKQLAAKRTARERQDPVKRAYLDDALASLGLSDPTGNVQLALARYALDDISNGVAIFVGKTDAGTLPEGVDIRYLLGIVRNIADEREGQAIATALWDERLKARDAVFDSLVRERDELSELDLDARLRSMVDRALASEREVERYFWLDAVAEVVLDCPLEQRRVAFERAARRIHTSYRVPHEQRLSATRVIAGKILPLA
jgi:hypothetical protein